MWFKTFSYLTGTLCFASSIYAAETPIKTKEWLYAKKTLGTDAGEVCTATTQKKAGDFVWTLALVVDPTRSQAPAIYVSTDAGDVGETLSLQTDSSRSLFKVSRDPREDARLASTVYWFAPDKLSTLYKQIRRDSNVKVSYPNAEGIEQKFYFSLSGSMAALDNLEKLCDAKKEVLYLPFFDSLDKQVAADGGDRNRGVESLKASLGDAWETYFVTGVHQGAIKELDAQMKPLLEQEKQFLSRSGKLTGELDQSNAQKTSIEAKRAGYIASKNKLTGELDRVESSLNTALADLKVREDIFRPVAEQVKPYLAAVDTAAVEVNHYSGRIRDHESRINSANGKISQLENQARNARSDIDNLEREERDLAPRLSRAQADLNGFNYQWELRRAIESDARYRWIEDDMRKNEQNIANYQQVYRNLEGQLRNAQADLRQCESRRSISSTSTEAALREDAARPKPPGPKPDPRPRPEPRPDPRPRPEPRPEPRPDPRPDCSRQRQRVNELARQLDSAASAINQEQRNLDSNRQNLERRRFELESEVHARYQAIQRVVSDLEARVTSVRSDINALERDVDDIHQNLIPRQRDLVDNSRSEIASLRPLLQNAEQRYADKRTELAAIVARTGYEKKRAEYLAAESSVKSFRDQATSLDVQIKLTEGQIAAQTKALAKVQIAIDDLVAKLAKETQGLEQIEAVLNPLREQKQVQVAALETAQAKLQLQMVAYRTVYKNTFATQNPVNLAPVMFYDWQH